MVYSKKSNFFCDCGEGGKCKSLPQGERPRSRANSKRPVKGDSLMPLGASGIFGGSRAPPSEEANMFNAIGRSGGLSKYANAFGEQIDDEDNEAALIFR